MIWIDLLYSDGFEQSMMRTVPFFLLIIACYLRDRQTGVMNSNAYIADVLLFRFGAILRVL